MKAGLTVLALLVWGLLDGPARADDGGTGAVSCPAGEEEWRGHCINTRETTYTYQVRNKPVCNDGCFSCQMAGGSIDPGIGGAVLLVGLRRRRRTT